MMLTPNIVSAITRKIRASTLFFPNKPLPSKFISETFVKTESDLMPSLVCSEVINVPSFSGLKRV